MIKIGPAPINHDAEPQETLHKHQMVEALA